MISLPYRNVEQSLFGGAVEISLKLV